MSGPHVLSYPTDATERCNKHIQKTTCFIAKLNPTGNFSQQTYFINLSTNVCVIVVAGECTVRQNKQRVDVDSIFQYTLALQQ